MKREPAIFLLLSMIVCCAAFCLPQVFGGALQFQQPYGRSFLIFFLTLLFILVLALFLFDRFKPLDEPVRAAASSPVWAKAGGAALLLTGLILTVSMMTWNDEQSNLEAGRYLWQHGLADYFNNYAEINKWLGRNHPPLLVLLYGLWYKATGFHLLAGRLLNLAFAAGAAWLTWRWVRLVADEAVAGLSVLCLVITPMWSFSSASALLDIPFVFGFMASMLFFERYIQAGRRFDVVLAGALAAVTTLCRYNGIFLFFIWFVQLLSHGETRALLIRPRTWLAVVVPGVLGMPWVALAIAQGTFAVQFSQLSEFLLVAFVRPGGWWYLSEVLLPLFPILMGIFAAPLFFYGLASCRKVRTPGVNRLVAACLTYLLLIAFTLPNPRYLLPAVPFLSAVYAVGFWRLAAQKKGMVVVLGAVLLCAATFLAYYTWATGTDLLYIFY